MDRFEQDEMRNLVFSKYAATFTKFLKAAKSDTKPAKQSSVQGVKKQSSKKFTYSFEQDIKQYLKPQDGHRLNKENKSYQVPQTYQTKPNPPFIIGNIYRIQKVYEDYESLVGKNIWVGGWARTIRKANNDKLIFIQLYDGSQQKDIQIAIDQGIEGFQQALACQKDSSFKIFGQVVLCAGDKAKQPFEISLNNPEIHKLEITGMVKDETYPLSKKFHTPEFLREIAHLRPRTNLIGCISRIRNNLSFATHLFFQTNGFLWIHTPLMTASDCEGAGELFQVTTLMPKEGQNVNVIPLNKNNNSVDYTKDFFNKPAFLTCSGQLSVENYCIAQSNVYTFGPTFRAENSNTNKHLAEFWMIEPEIAFADLFDVIDCAEQYIKFCCKYVLDNNKDDLIFLNERRVELEKKKESGGLTNFDLISQLQLIVNEPFAKCTYTEAIGLLEKAAQNGKEFEKYVKWGDDMATEHERFLSEYVFKKPVCVYNYPESFKAFYMRQNEDGKTVASVDILAPGVGEVVGGSQREERLEILEQKILSKGMKVEEYKFYTDLRKYGSVPHGGFGLGLERLIMLATGQENIREVIPFPRTPGTCEF